MSSREREFEMDADGKPSSFVFIDYLAKGAEFVMVTLTFLMIVFVTYQVFERHVLHYAPPWSEEFAVYSGNLPMPQWV